MKKAILFPGQGAQTKGMGGSLFRAYPQLTQQASDLLGDDIAELCLDDPKQQLNQTQYTQPALYVVNALSFYKQQKVEKVTPDFALGHSLGEYNALLAANAFDFATGLSLVQKRGELMSQAARGAMAAVIGLRPERTMEILVQEGLTAIEPANYNTPTQLVIAGLMNDIEQAIDVLMDAGAKVVPLPVSAAFHSSYMQSAQQAFEQFISTFSFNQLSFPVIANATATPYEDDKIGQTLTQQIVAPVKWVDSMKYLMNRHEIEYIAINSTILANMVAAIRAHGQGSIQ